MSPDARVPLLEGKDVVKYYGHVQALRGADFTVNRNEVVALVGDNGAGKSTLIKILSGTLEPNGGEIFFEGRRTVIDSPTTAHKLGIETVYQDLALAPDLNAADNMFIGREAVRPGLLGRLGFLDKPAMRARAAETYGSLGVELQSMAAPVAALSGGQRQGVAVARAAMWASKLIIMDEPTASLGVVQAKRVLELIARVKRSGLSVVIVSHNLPQIFEVSDRIEVLRLGRRVATFVTQETSMDDVVAAMTGALEHREAS
jgi:simple sugar transport system ATP-binding protein